MGSGWRDGVANYLKLLAKDRKITYL